MLGSCSTSLVFALVMAILDFKARTGVGLAFNRVRGKRDEDRSRALRLDPGLDLPELINAAFLWPPVAERTVGWSKWTTTFSMCEWRTCLASTSVTTCLLEWKCACVTQSLSSSTQLALNSTWRREKSGVMGVNAVTLVLTYQ